MNQYFKLQKNKWVFSGEIYTSASLKLKWLTQRTQVRFRRHFIVALLRKKFLGEIFALDEILETFKRIKLNPDAWAPFSDRTRRCLVHRFPYGIIYQIRENEISIIAIAHMHRKPDYWKDRMNP